MNQIGFSLLSLLFLFLASCAFDSKNRSASIDDSQSVAGIGHKAKLEEMTREIPHEHNEHVDKWLNYFQGRGRQHMERYLIRSRKYLNMMRKILKENQVPQDLVYVSLIESGFNTFAHSRASAVGPWQFIRGTAKRYGLKVDYWIDERRDPELSTAAACQYFKALNNVFGSWYLAMASYNVGENRVKRAVMRHYTRDIWKLVKLRALPRETLNYVPKFLAARLIAQDPEKYGFVNLSYDIPLNFHKVQVKSSISLKKLAKNLNISYLELKSLNPKFRREFVPINRKNSVEEIRIPLNLVDKVQIALENSVVNISKDVLTRGRTTTYRVRRGDNLTRIARRFGTSISYLRSINGFSRNSILRAGSHIKVKAPRYSSIKNRNVSSISISNSDKALVPYKIRYGDSLYSIAKKFGTSIKNLKRINKLRGNKIIIGRILKVPNLSDSDKVHVVRRGDTLIAIARKYEVPLSHLTVVNNISNREKIFAGDKIIIPISKN